MGRDCKLESYLWEFKSAVECIVPLYMKCMDYEALEGILSYCEGLEVDNKLYMNPYNNNKYSIDELKVAIQRLRKNINERRGLT